MIYEDGDRNKMQFLFHLFRILNLFPTIKGNKICSELRKYRTEASITEFILNDN